VIFWEKPEHWEFSPLGKVAELTAHKATSFIEVLSFLEPAEKGRLEPKEQEIEALIKAVRPGKTSAATAIVQLVLGDFSATKGE
jgi:hypothetical protein